MPSMQSLDIQDRSATTTATPQVRGAVQEVAKLIDISKCIGCKACQVACMQWNDLRDDIGTNVGVYDNPTDLTDQSWTVMRFAEIARDDGSMEWLIRKDGCMHCEDPGCLKACPAPGAIVKYANGIVDFISENCIGCGYCIAGCPLLFWRAKYASVRRLPPPTLPMRSLDSGSRPASRAASAFFSARRASCVSCVRAGGTGDRVDSCAARARSSGVTAVTPVVAGGASIVSTFFAPAAAFSP
jgi:formate dehydrogenase beta subunit